MVALRNLEVYKLAHSGLLVKNSKSRNVIVFDPYQVSPEAIKESSNIGAVFFTHDHFDHFSPKDVGLLAKKTTQYVFPMTILEKGKTFLTQDDAMLIPVLPLDEYSVKFVDGEEVKFMAVPAYNINKVSPQGNSYHPQNKDFVGYLIEMDSVTVYVAGDTDNIPEMAALEDMVDIAFLPISGTYVMTIDEAVEASKVIKPQIVIPCHFGVVAGDPDMGEAFKKKMQEELPGVQVVIE